MTQGIELVVVAAAAAAAVKSQHLNSMNLGYHLIVAQLQPLSVLHRIKEDLENY